MRRLIELALLTGLATSLASAGPLSVLFQGAFTQDDQVELFSFMTDGTTDVTIQSYGYAGGMFDSTTIASGGFSPNAILFDGTGTEIASDSGGHCGITLQDSITLECNDPYIAEPSLAAGTYTLALAEWGNGPNDSLLADGFVETGNPGFTCAEFGLTGNFCDTTTALGTQRTGNYAIAISGVAAASDITYSTPEPTTLLLLIGGMAGALFYRRRLN